MFVMEPLKSMETVLPEAATPALELVCPAGSLPALKAAVDHGAMFSFSTSHRTFSFP